MPEEVQAANKLKGGETVNRTGSEKKKMSRAQDRVLEYMLILMDFGGAQGFVHGIIPEKGKPVSGRLR